MSDVTKFTRGTWKPIKSKWGIQADTETLIATIFVDSITGDRDIQIISGTAPFSFLGASEEEWWPNARLIAAAPDMFAALAEVANSDMAQREEDEGNVSPMLGKVRAALAKARGEVSK